MYRTDGGYCTTCTVPADRPTDSWMLPSIKKKWVYVLVCVKCISKYHTYTTIKGVCACFVLLTESRTRTCATALLLHTYTYTSYLQMLRETRQHTPNQSKHIYGGASCRLSIRSIQERVHVHMASAVSHKRYQCGVSGIKTLPPPSNRSKQLLHSS